MSKKTDSKTAAKTVKKKAAAKPAATSKPAAAVKPTASAKSTAEPVAAKSKSPAKAANKPAAKKSAPPAAAVKKPAGKNKTELNRLQISAEAAVPKSSSAAPTTAHAESQFFYFLSETIDPQVTRVRPALGQLSGRVSEFAEFAEARQHAIDYLVDLIDRCEVRLWQIKRADSLDTYQQLVREHEHPQKPAAGEEAPPAPS